MDTNAQRSTFNPGTHGTGTQRSIGGGAGDGLESRPDFAGDFEAFQVVRARRRKMLRGRLAGFFPKAGPVVLEVGSGHGHFLTSYASAHPDHFCVGIDLMADRVRRAIKKQERAGLENLHFLRCEGIEFMECLPEGPLFQRAFVLFPDPWPKKRHHKNRLLTGAFFDALAPRCASGAQFFFRTDHVPYFEDVRESLRGHPRWELKEMPVWPFEERTVFQERATAYASLIAVRGRS